MKTNVLLLAGICLILSSCGIHNGLTKNSNVRTTDVVLAKNNFKVVARVKGESKATYVFGFGGLARQALIEEARVNMLSKIDIIGGSKAIINETVELKNSYFLIVVTSKVIVSAHVIEFLE